MSENKMPENLAGMTAEERAGWLSGLPSIAHVETPAFGAEAAPRLAALRAADREAEREATTQRIAENVPAYIRGGVWDARKEAPARIIREWEKKK